MLLTMLRDSSQIVRGNAALSLVRFGDAAGRAQIVALLQPASIIAPAAGRVVDLDKMGTFVRQGGLITKLQGGERTTEIRSPISGRIRSISVATGAIVAAGAEVATIDPSSEQVWEALRALYLVGQLGDLPAVRIYEHNMPEMPDRLREQALLTEKAIQTRGVE
jgi:pyruvate carboxylase